MSVQLLKMNKEIKTSDYKSFHYLESGEISFSQLNTIKSQSVLDSGSYKIVYKEYPIDRIILSQDADSETSKIFHFQDKEKIDLLISSFFDTNVISTVNNLGFNHKIGILFYGKEGGGKSTIIKHYYSRLIKERDALVFHIINMNFRVKECWDFILNIRKIQSNPIIIIFDEFDGFMKESEPFLKTAIDGNMSISNCLFMASTNYLELIPDAMKKRPSRFKYLVKVEGIEKINDIIPIVTALLKDLFSESEILSFSNKLKGNTLDEIKHFCLDKIMNLKTYDKKSNTVGFIRA